MRNICLLIFWHIVANIKNSYIHQYYRIVKANRGRSLKHPNAIYTDTAQNPQSDLTNVFYPTCLNLRFSKQLNLQNKTSITKHCCLGLYFWSCHFNKFPLVYIPAKFAKVFEQNGDNPQRKTVDSWMLISESSIGPLAWVFIFLLFRLMFRAKRRFLFSLHAVSGNLLARHRSLLSNRASTTWTMSAKTSSKLVALASGPQHRSGINTEEKHDCLETPVKTADFILREWRKEMVFLPIFTGVYPFRPSMYWCEKSFLLCWLLQTPIWESSRDHCLQIWHIISLRF